MLHPYRTAELLLADDQCLGVFGQINPIIAKKNNISTDIFLFEFNLDIIKTEYLLLLLMIVRRYNVHFLIKIIPVNALQFLMLK